MLATGIGDNRLRSATSVLFLAGIFLATAGPLLLPTRSFLLIALGMVVVTVFQTPQALKIHSIDVLVLFFLGTLLISGFVTGEPGGHYWEIVRWLSLAVIAKLAVALYPKPHLALGIAAQGLLLAGIALASNIASTGFSWVLDFRLESEFIHKNDLGAMIGLAIITLLAVAPTWWGGTTVRSLGVLSVAVLGITLLYLQSLAAVGATAIGVASMVLWWMLRASPPFLRKIGLGLIWLLPALVVALGQALGIFTALGKRSDLYGRIDIWSFTRPDWSDHWLFGHPGGYWTAERTNAFAEKEGFDTTVSDNSFLDLFLNYGLLTLLVFLILIAWILARSGRNFVHDSREPIWPTVAILFLLTISFFNSTLFSPMFFIILAVLICSSPASKGNNETQHSQPEGLVAPDTLSRSESTSKTPRK